MDTSIFDGARPAKQHLWQISLQTIGVLENDASEVVLFSNTLTDLALKEVLNDGPL